LKVRWYQAFFNPSQPCQGGTANSSWTRSPALFFINDRSYYWLAFIGNSFSTSWTLKSLA